MTCTTPFRWTSASRSHVGLVREINEDACLELPKLGLWAVADGMGGHTLGDLASQMVIDALRQLLPPVSLAEFAARVRNGLQAVNGQLRQEAAIRAVPVIGSTVALLFACDQQCICLWAGDSRIYLYRQGRLVQLTRDHSQIEALKSRGALTAEEARHHPARNLITRAVGAMDSLDLDEESIEVDDGDMFLLCSDGLSNEVSAEDMGAVLASGNAPQAAETLIEMALKEGGHDNITVVVVRAEDLNATDKTLQNPALL